MRVIVAAGGTGGHIYPALAIIERIKKEDKNSKILYLEQLTVWKRILFLAVVLILLV